MPVRRPSSPGDSPTTQPPPAWSLSRPVQGVLGGPDKYWARIKWLLLKVGPGANLRFTVVMAAGEIADAVLGGLMLGVFPDVVLIPALALILLASAVKLARPTDSATLPLPRRVGVPPVLMNITPA